MQPTQRSLTAFQQMRWNHDRLEILRRKWLTYEDSLSVCAAINRTNADTLLPISPYACRQMAAKLRIKRPVGFISVDRIRTFTAGTKGAERRIEFAIAQAKAVAQRERQRRKRLADKEKMLQKQQVAAEKIAVPVMEKPAWMKPDAPVSKRKRRRGRPFSLQAMRGADAGTRTVLERAARARIDGMFAQLKTRS